MLSTEPYKSLFGCFLRGLQLGGDNTCLHLDEKLTTYAEMASKVYTLLSVLQKIKDRHSVAAVYANYEENLFVGLLSVLAWGKGYVPISPDFPDKRCIDLIRISKTNTIITSQDQAKRLVEMLNKHQLSCNVVILGEGKQKLLPSGLSVRNVAFSKTSKNTNMELSEPNEIAKEIAYLMFTSGSTGQPKGVPITHKNVLHFIKTMHDRYRTTPKDRIICLPEFFFDLSIFPIWTALYAGAAIYIPSKKDRLLPANYINKQKITIWCSVPSSISILSKFNLIQQNSFPSIRASIFCGEPLFKLHARQWALACPNSVNDNFYGPTEVTVFSTVYRFDTSSTDFGNGDVVSIGKPLPGVDTCIINEDQNPVSTNEAGEICLSGIQVAMGYWEDPQKSIENFRTIKGTIETQSKKWYFTGDMVYATEDGNMMFKCRIDDQVKILGYRVELGEIEAVARKGDRIKESVAIFSQAPEVISLFVAGENINKQKVKEDLEKYLPHYMVPKNIFIISEMPLNKNGKVNKIALKKLLG